MFDLILLQIILTATVGKSYQGDIAVDDVSFTDGLCENENEAGVIPQGVTISDVYKFIT